MNPHGRRARLFARMALLAALLLATVPTLGRLLGPAAAAAPMAQVHHMAHGMGMAMAMDHAMPGDTARADDAAHAPAHPLQHEHDADCAYCPLLATTLAAPMQALVVAAAPLPPPEPQRFESSRVTQRVHGSLGSRGPPAIA